MAYVRTLHKAFPQLDDGVFVVIRNPALMPLTALVPEEQVERDAQGRPKDLARLREVNARWLASFITEWHVPDPADESDEPALLGEPSAATVGRCPGLITSWIVDQITAVTDPS